MASSGLWKKHTMKILQDLYRYLLRLKTLKDAEYYLNLKQLYMHDFYLIQCSYLTVLDFGPTCSKAAATSRHIFMGK